MFVGLNRNLHKLSLKNKNQKIYKYFFTNKIGVLKCYNKFN